MNQLPLNLFYDIPYLSLRVFLSSVVVAHSFHININFPLTVNDRQQLVLNSPSVESLERPALAFYDSMLSSMLKLA